MVEVDEEEPLKEEAAEVPGVVVKEEQEEEVQPAQAAAPAAPLGLHSGQAPDGHPPPRGVGFGPRPSAGGRCSGGRWSPPAT